MTNCSNSDLARSLCGNLQDNPIKTIIAIYMSELNTSQSAQWSRDSRLLEWIFTFKSQY